MSPLSLPITLNMIQLSYNILTSYRNLILKVNLSQVTSNIYDFGFHFINVLYFNVAHLKLIHHRNFLINIWNFYSFLTSLSYFKCFRKPLVY